MEHSTHSLTIHYDSTWNDFSEAINLLETQDRPAIMAQPTNGTSVLSTIPSAEQI